MRKKTIYNAAMGLWFVLVTAGTFAVFTGQVESILPPSAIPGGPMVMFGGATAAVVAGALIVSVLKKRSWRAAGRAAGLTPENASLRSTLPVGSYPALTGAVEGRDVRVHRVKRKEGSGGESGSKTVTYTVAETRMDERLDPGTMIGRSDDGSDLVDFGGPGLENDVVEGPFVAVGDGGGLVREVLAGPAREPLRSVDSLGLSVGNTAAAMKAVLPDNSDSFLGKAVGGMMKKGIEKKVQSDPSAVSNETKGLILDPDEIRHQAEAVAAVANAFDDANADAARTTSEGATTN
jgi:hypothetical protein